MKPRARDLGIPLDGKPGILNAITDVAGVEVGHSTIITGTGKLEIGKGPVRTGITAILPRGKTFSPVFAGTYSLNGNGEMTGTIWIEESGFLGGPILITNTHSVGIARDATIAWHMERNIYDQNGGNRWFLPVVAETYDGFLNDINGFHVQKEHVFAALDGAHTGKVEEGVVGGGTGMRCYQFKGGIGTSSRVVHLAEFPFTVGALVQSNYGYRHELTVVGAPVGREIADLLPEAGPTLLTPGAGSIIIVIATDAPLLPHQLKRLARRIPMGIARMGGSSSNFSGDIFIAFSTANKGAADISKPPLLNMIPNEMMDPLHVAVTQATEEAILNSMLAAETTIGVNDNKVYALPHDRLVAVLKKYNRM
jgi:D-aminopeptidase